MLRNRGLLRGKKFMAALLLILVPVLAACGAEPATPTTAPTPPTSTTAMEPPTATTAMEMPTETAMPEATATMAMELPTATMPMEMPTETAAPVPTDTVAPAPTDTAAPVNAGPVEIQATLREWALDVSQTEVAAGTVRFVVGNAGQFARNFAIRPDGGDQITRTPNFTSGDGEQIVEVELQPGTYILYCALPGHEQQGQRAVLVVN